MLTSYLPARVLLLYRGKKKTVKFHAECGFHTPAVRLFACLGIAATLLFAILPGAATAQSRAVILPDSPPEPDELALEGSDDIQDIRSSVRITATATPVATRQESVEYAITPRGIEYVSCVNPRWTTPQWVRAPGNFDEYKSFQTVCDRQAGAAFRPNIGYSDHTIFNAPGILPNLTVFYDCGYRFIFGLVYSKSQCTLRGMADSRGPVMSENQRTLTFIKSFTSPVTVYENTDTVGGTSLFEATGFYDGDAVAYSLYGESAALFNISNSGTLTFKATPDYESPAGGARGDSNDYQVIVTVVSGTGFRRQTAMQTVTVRVTNVYEPTAFISTSGTIPGTRVVDDVRVTSSLRIAPDAPVMVRNNPTQVAINRLPLPPPNGLSQVVAITVAGSSQALPDGHSVGSDPAHQTYVDINITVDGVPLKLAPGGSLEVCLPVSDGLHEEASNRPLVFLHHDGTDWEALVEFTLNAAGNQMCGIATSVSPFAMGFEVLPLAARNRIAEQWLARFGRTVATQAVDTIGDRMMGGVSGSQLTLGGQQLNLKDQARGYAGSLQPIKSLQLVRSLQLIKSLQLIRSFSR